MDRRLERYTDEGHPYRLMLSLTSAFSEKRARLVPLTARYGVPELAAAMEVPMKKLQIIRRAIKAFHAPPQAPAGEDGQPLDHQVPASAQLGVHLRDVVLGSLERRADRILDRVLARLD